MSSSQQLGVLRQSYYLCVKVVLVDPSAPGHRAFQCVGLLMSRTLVWTPDTFTASGCRSNTCSICARKGTRGRTEWGEEVFLVVVGGADVMDEIVTDGLCAEWTSSRLI